MNSKLLLSIFVACGLVACGGGGDGSGARNDIPNPSISAAAARGLKYTDPVSTGWRLVKDPALTTPSRVVLNLVGPDGLTVRGVGFNLKRGTCAAFGTFNGGAYAQNTYVFELKGSNPSFEPYAGTEADPVLFVSAPLKVGNVLSTGIFQKDRTRTPKRVDGTGLVNGDAAQKDYVVKVAVELSKDREAKCRAGDVMALFVNKARIIPADIGAPDFQLTYEAIAKAKMVDIPVDVGSLVAN